jgi:hypothetical protein
VKYQLLQTKELKQLIMMCQQREWKCAYNFIVAHSKEIFALPQPRSSNKRINNGRAIENGRSDNNNSGKQNYNNLDPDGD